MQVITVRVRDGNLAMEAITARARVIPRNLDASLSLIDEELHPIVRLLASLSVDSYIANASSAYMYKMSIKKKEWVFVYFDSIFMC